MKQKKRNIIKYLAYLGIPFFVVFISSVYAADVVSSVFTSQTATASGSSNSIISVDNNLSYINKGDNSAIIGNYFSGYYYDSILGYFETDWSSNRTENVRVVWSTSACGSSYGYKLGWYAYSTAFGFVDFDFSNSVFVYYCVGDDSLHGYSYSEDLWFQNFEGITFDIETSPSAIPEVPTGTGVFLNDTTTIIEEPTTDPRDPVTPPGEQEDSNFSPNSTIQADIIKLDADKESLFYIIK